MDKFFKVLGQMFYVLAILSIPLSIAVYQEDPIKGIFTGLWAPTLLLLGPSCPWRKTD